MNFAYIPAPAPAVQLLELGPPVAPIAMVAVLFLILAALLMPRFSLPALPAFSYQRKGGLRFVKLGRYGASFYVSRKPAGAR